MKKFTLDQILTLLEKKEEGHIHYYNGNIYISKEHGRIIFGLKEVFLSKHKLAEFNKYEYLEFGNKKEGLTKKGKFSGGCYVYSTHEKKRLHLKSILEQFHEDRQYTPQDLYNAIDCIKNHWNKKRKLSEEDYIGLWGELYFLKKMIQNCNENNIYDIVFSWEKTSHEKNRSIIDFKTKKAVIEVKTTTQSSRIHHIGSLKQITCPENYKLGFLCSILIKNESSGYDCKELINKITFLLSKYDKCLNLFTEKINSRINIRFENSKKYLLNYGGALCYNFNTIPKPEVNKNIIDVSWGVKLDFGGEPFENIKNLII